jgi:tetratricopeptide (TPR) repeat protein
VAAHAAGAAALEDGDAATALPLLEGAASRSAMAEPWIALAAARRQTGDAAGAIAAAERALEIRPGDAAALRNLGLARLDAGDGDGAARALDQARQAGDAPEDLDRWIREAKMQKKGGAP